MMDSGKQGSSETSSDENDRQEQVKEDSTATSTAVSATAKRSYECTFCKRGFTNAQALGGHMNIHRKDRAKAKQVTTTSSISPKPNEEHMNPNYLVPISSESMNYYPVLKTQTNFPPVYFQPSGNSYYHGIQNHQSLDMNEELWGANLSLQIGSNHIEDNGDVSKEDELDLELRLGHDR